MAAGPTNGPGSCPEFTTPAGEFKLSLEPDYCCGGGHCGPLPGYVFDCPSCGKRTGCRLGDYLNVGEILTCYLCKVRIRAIEQTGEFEYIFTYDDGPSSGQK